MEDARKLVDTRTRIRDLGYWSVKLPLNIGGYGRFVSLWRDFHILLGRCGVELKVMFEAVFWILNQIKVPYVFLHLGASHFHPLVGLTDLDWSS